MPRQRCASSIRSAAAQQMAIVSSATCQVGRRLNSLRYAACEQVRKRQEVEPGDIVWVAAVQTQAVFKAWQKQADNSELRSQLFLG